MTPGDHDQGVLTCVSAGRCHGLIEGLEFAKHRLGIVIARTDSDEGIIDNEEVTAPVGLEIADRDAHQIGKGPLSGGDFPRLARGEARGGEKGEDWIFLPEGPRIEFPDAAGNHGPLVGEGLESRCRRVLVLIPETCGQVVWLVIDELGEDVLAVSRIRSPCIECGRRG